MSGDREARSRRQRERQHHKQEILSAALRLFSARGFHNVSMQEIASEAEFATGTLYHFFPSKEALFDELVRDCAERITNNLVAVLDAPGTEAERLANYFRSLPGELEEHTLLLRLYISEMGVRSVRLARDPGRPQGTTLMTAKVRDLVAAGIRKGCFRQVHPDIVALAINSTVETLAFDMAEHFDRAKATYLFEQVERFFLDGLLKLPELRKGHTDP